MRPLALTGFTAVSAVGRGVQETLNALKTRRGGLRPCDFGGVTAGGYIGRVDGLETHRIPEELAQFDCRNNRLADYALRTDGFGNVVARARERYGSDRIAVILGTSTSGVQATEDAYRQRDPETGVLPAWFDYEHTHDLFSLARFVRAVLELRGPALVVSTACASSAKTFIDAYHLIESGVCDAAVVGGVDTLCRLTLNGFAALDLISDGPCRPFDAERSGLSIGEAAGFALLERPDRDGAAARRIMLLGYGETSDGYHMSSPHPQGVGAIEAMRKALECAAIPAAAIDYVNLHGTGTRANDAMEAHAVVSAFGTDVVCSGTKAWSGHTLGAAGILEAVISTICIHEHFVPGCLNVSELDPSFAANITLENLHKPVRRVMSNSFGFGGINCSLILGLPP